MPGGLVNMLNCLLALLLGAMPQGETAGPGAIAFAGLHGGAFEHLARHARALGVAVDYVSDERIEREAVDLSRYRVVVLQHVRSEHRDHYLRLLEAARRRNADLRVLDLSGGAARRLPDLARRGILEHDPELRRYYGGSPENLRRMVVYLAARYLKRPLPVEPPRETSFVGLHHPDHEGAFESAEEFLAWAAARGADVEHAPRAAVAVHATHLALQQPRVVDALVRALEREGFVAVAIVDLRPGYEELLESLRPDCVVHTCHSRDSIGFRERLDAVHLQSLFFRRQSIADWETGVTGLAANEMSLQISSQEVLGTIEPLAAAGTRSGDGGAEAFSPIEERVEHLAARASSWARLRRARNADKRIAFVYWDREMGKGELMRGSATGMFLNGPRSLVRVLAAMKERGYGVDPLPSGERELVAWMMDHGRRIGVWAPGVLDRLARSGKAVLVPAERYRRWFEEKVPAARRAEVVARWGEPPGRFMVWKRDGEAFVVIPRIDLGHVILLPQPLRGEAHDTSLLHDRHLPPPHSYLCTYFWLQEEFRADALVHFGTHGSEFLLPGKPTASSRADWPDLLMGRMPNVNPWVINNLGESSAVRRRAYAVLVDHLVPPSVSAGLSDELANLHDDIDKWATLEEGALKQRFRALITEQVHALHLERDLHLGSHDGGALSDEQIHEVAAYLHDVHNETIPGSLHVLGRSPRRDLLAPWIATCLRSRFLEHLAEVVAVPAEESREPGDREKYLRRKAEEILRLVLDRGMAPSAAVAAAAGRAGSAVLSDELREDFELAARLSEGFARTGNEIEGLFAALDGRFVPPGPSGSPDRNPAVLPTGRNMYLLSPEEIPSRPSWEIGKRLVDRLLARQLETRGRYPDRIAFTLNAFASFQDYGVMEAQILYAMGVRPVWDERNLVHGLEVIPAGELGRPRIDVFLSVLGYYRDMLPTRMRLLDKAVRLVAALDEPDNHVHANTRRVAKELEERGVASERAERLARARIFGRAPGQFGSAGYYYLVERSGEWDTREELVRAYLEHSRCAYTEGAWGEDAPLAYERQIQGCEVLLRNWSDRTRSPLSNKYVWYKGGSLSLAIAHLTGKEPEWFLSDVRDPDRARLVVAEDALRRDFRARLFNRSWIENMMKEGYAGADQIAVHVSNAFGWKIMRPASVGDDLFERITDVFVRDSKDLDIREWFEDRNPFAFQEITEVLLETIRKGYWRPDEATVREIAEAYARSVARHGEGGGLRGGGNVKLEQMVRRVLEAPGDGELSELLARYDQRLEESATESLPEAAPAPATETVRGRRMVPAAEEEDAAHWPWDALAGAAFALLVLVGAIARAGTAS